MSSPQRFLPNLQKELGRITLSSLSLFIGETSFPYSECMCVSEIPVYYENLWRVPKLCEHLYTLHFEKAWKFLIVAWQITTWRHDRTSNKSQLITSRQDSFPFCRKQCRNCMAVRFSKKVSSLQITLKLQGNHNLNHCAPMDNSLIRLCPQPSNPKTVWKLRLSAFWMCYYFFGVILVSFLTKIH